MLPLVPYLDMLRWVFIALALAGIAVAIYARLCGRAGSDALIVAACPPAVGYVAELQARVAVEVEALPEGSAVADLLSDYAVMRDQARAFAC